MALKNARISPQPLLVPLHFAGALLNPPTGEREQSPGDPPHPRRGAEPAWRWAAAPPAQRLPRGSALPRRRPAPAGGRGWCRGGGAGAGAGAGGGSPPGAVHGAAGGQRGGQTLASAAAALPAGVAMDACGGQGGERRNRGAEEPGCGVSPQDAAGCEPGGGGGGSAGRRRVSAERPEPPRGANPPVCASAVRGDWRSADRSPARRYCSLHGSRASLGCKTSGRGRHRWMEELSWLAREAAGFARRRMRDSRDC